MTRVVVLGVVVAVAAAAGCAPDRTATPAPRPSSPAPSSPAHGCPVTVPRPVPSDQDWRHGLFGADRAYGNDKLWVGGLADRGVIEAAALPAEADGSIRTKFGWWRPPSTRGTLRITGRRLDGDAPPLRAWVPSGYGDTGFQSSGVHFPTPGCWEVTGRVGTASLTFVTLVIV